MRRKWRPILATISVLVLAAFEYVHSAVHTLGIASPSYTFDSENGKLADVQSEIRRLDGRVVTVEGFMIPMDQAEDIRQFAVVPQLNFGGLIPPPSLNQTVVANLPHATVYNPERIRVSGRLHVRVTMDEGFLISLYDMDVESVSTVYSGPVATWPWYVIGTTPVAGLAVILRGTIIRRRLRRAGHCVGCWYDLRATPLRCPECGLIAV